MHNSTLETLMSHRSIRKFSSEQVSDEQLDLLIQAGQAASSSSFIQAYSIIDICDTRIRNQLQACCSNQEYVSAAPRFLVFCADFHRLQQAARHHAIQAELGFTEQLLAASIDAALVAQNILIAAESLGLGGVYIGAIRNQPEEVTKILELPEQVFAVFGMCLGYPDQQPQIKPRLPTPMVLHKDRYDAARFDQSITEYDSIIADYYSQRTQGKVSSSWSQQMADKLGKESRPGILEYLKKQGFARR